MNSNKQLNSYPLWFKLKVVQFYNDKCASINEIINIFGISNGSLYNWVNDYNKNNLTDKKKYKKKKVKITLDIKMYICKFVLKRSIFDYKTLIKNIKNKFRNFKKFNL